MCRRGLIALLAALSVLVPSQAQAIRAPTPVPCDALGISPNYLQDRMVACVARKIDLPELGPTGVLVSVSTDGGRSWRTQAATGLPSAQASIWDDLQFSPDFARDGIFYVQEQTGGLFRTADGGASFTAADPLALGGGVRAQLSPMWLAPGGAAAPGLPVPLGPIPGFAYAGAAPAFISPPAHVPVAGTPAQVQAFVALNRRDRTSVVLAVSQDSGQAQSYISLCTGVLACAQQVEKIPAGQILEGVAPLLLGPDLPAAWIGTRQFSNSQQLSAQNRLLTRDGKVRRLPALDRILAAFVGDPWSIHFWLTNGATAGSLIARISRGTLVQSGPTDVLYASTDMGAHWTLIAKATNKGVFSAPGGLPSPSNGSNYFSKAIFAAPDGRLFTLGRPSTGTNALLGAVMCSTDRGRTWHERCSG